MLSPRKQAILKSIVEQYISRAVPVPSQDIVKKYDLAVSSATVRNEMAYLEQEGYIYRPHTSAGSIPSDKGYRYYVETMDAPSIPLSDRVFIDHLFHQVEEDMESWLSLAATLIARMTHNVAVVGKPRASGARFKHVELVALQDLLTLIIFVLYGARVRQQLINFPEPVDQDQLDTIANKLNRLYFGLTREEINNKQTDLTEHEALITKHLVNIMKMEDNKDVEEAYLEGWHYLFNEPEFAHTSRLQALMELAEHRNLLRTITPPELPEEGVTVVIGKENEVEAMQNYSVVIGTYGFPGELTGTVGLVGPTRMQYRRNLAVVRYLTFVLGELIGELYGKKQEFGSAPYNGDSRTEQDL